MNIYLHVCTSADKPNIPAIKCYQKNGFNLIEVRKGQNNIGGQDLYKLTKVIY